MASRSGTLYAGTSLTLTCTTTLDDSVDDGEVVNTVWTGPGLSSDRVTAMDEELDFSVLDEDDDGTYTCEVTVTPRSGRESSVSASPSITRQQEVSVLGEAHRTVRISKSFTCLSNIVLFPFRYPYSNSSHHSNW